MRPNPKPMDRDDNDISLNKLQERKILYIPVHNPTVTYKVETLGVVALIARPAAASTDPAIVTARHPKRLTSTEAMGPTPRVTPLRMEGMRETVPRPSPKASISSTTKMPKVYVIPSAEKLTSFSVSSRLLQSQIHKTK